MTPSQSAWLALCAYTCQCVLLHLSSWPGASFNSQRAQVSSLLLPVLARVLLSRQAFSVIWRAALLGTCGALATHLLLWGDQVCHHVATTPL